MVKPMSRKARGETIWRIHKYRTQKQDGENSSNDSSHGSAIGKDEIMEQLKQARKRYGSDFSSEDFALDDDFCSPGTVANYFGSWSEAKEQLEVLEFHS